MYTVTLKSGKTSVITANDRGVLTRIAICISDEVGCKWSIAVKGSQFVLTVASRISQPKLQHIIDTQLNPAIVKLTVA